MAIVNLLVSHGHSSSYSSSLHRVCHCNHIHSHILARLPAHLIIYLLANERDKHVCSCKKIHCDKSSAAMTSSSVASSSIQQLYLFSFSREWRMKNVAVQQ